MEGLAAAAVALLAPYFAEAGKSIAGKAGDAAVAGTKTLYSAVRGRFDDVGDSYGKQALLRLEENPANERRQRAVADVLAEAAENDPAFRDELKRLVAEATEGKEVDQFLVQVYGGEVGKIVQIQYAKSVSF